MCDASRSFVVGGLGFGDEGKGTIVDFLCRRYSASAVIRYNGGPQAAHHVVLSDKRWHCFSQFGSGTFITGMKTHLSSRMLIKPSNLLMERDALAEKGQGDAMKRLTLDPHACLVTPWHGLLGQLKELSRGPHRHGSVGMGVGEAAFDRANDPGALQLGDLRQRDVLASKLERHFMLKMEESREFVKRGGPEANALFLRFAAENPLSRIAAFYEDFGRRYAANFAGDQSVFHEHARRGNTLVLEGAQGALLDVKRGFFPYVTKTDVTLNAGSALLSRGMQSETTTVTKVGVLRGYFTRHGAGPFVTYDEKLTRAPWERHNGTNAWQGTFRAGWFDLLLARYALATSGGVDYLALTCLDLLMELPSVKICTSYEYAGDISRLDGFFEYTKHANKARIHAIKPQATAARQMELARLLFDCRPGEYAEFGGWGDQRLGRPSKVPEGAARFINYIESPEGLATPVGILSFGATAEDKILC